MPKIRSTLNGGRELAVRVGAVPYPYPEIVHLGQKFILREIGSNEGKSVKVVSVIDSVHCIVQVVDRWGEGDPATEAAVPLALLEVK